MPTEWIWFNGQVQKLSETRIAVEDRGYQFADGVYEVIRLYDGIPFTLAEHLDRLHRSATGIDIHPPVSKAELSAEIFKFIARTGIGEGMVYLQLTRGVSPRNHVVPENISPTLLFYVRPLPPVLAPGTGIGTKLLSVPDERWKRCWIKSIALLPNILAKTHAVSRGFDEAVFVDDGFVNECSASNLFAIVNRTLITHPVGPKVLPGITRAVLLKIAAALHIPVEERPLLESDALAADELFITSTTREISWVSQWNDQPVAGSRCGNITLQLHRAFQEQVRTELSSIIATQPRASA